MSRLSVLMCHFTQAMGTASQGVRAMSGPAHETPLTKIMPPLVALPRQVLSTAFGLTGVCVCVCVCVRARARAHAHVFAYTRVHLPHAHPPQSSDDM